VRDDVATRQRFETAGTAAWAYSICTNTCPQPHSEDKNLVYDFLTRLSGTRLGFDPADEAASASTACFSHPRGESARNESAALRSVHWILW
jgi:hypothetical protein